MSNILVTGGAGFIASELAIRLAQNEENTVVVVDSLITGDTAKLPLDAYDNLHFIKCDVNVYEDIAGIFHAYHFDYVFHYAALVGVLRTQANPVKVLDDVIGIRNILNLSKNSRVKRVLYSSSSKPSWILSLISSINSCSSSDLASYQASNDSVARGNTADGFGIEIIIKKGSFDCESVT